MNTSQSLCNGIKFRGFMIVGLALISATIAAQTATGQSGTRTAPPRTNASNSSPTLGSATKATGSTVGLQGYCPVCVIEMKKWVKGKDDFSVQYDGKTYLFPSDEQKQMFLKNPQKYSPVLGGDCTVALVEMNKRIPGSVQHAAFSDGRIFLFSKPEAKEMFMANAAKYKSADLALNGKCTVCRVEMNQEIEGAPEFTVLYKGMRYEWRCHRVF